jgi:hypothetical protein
MSDLPVAWPNGDDAIVHAAMERLRKRVDEHDGRLQHLDAIVKDLEDALVVHAHLEKRKAERIKEHTEFISRNAEFISRHEESVRYHDLKMREFDEKLNALIDIVMLREGGPEAQR